MQLNNTVQPHCCPERGGLMRKTIMTLFALILFSSAAALAQDQPTPAEPKEDTRTSAEPSDLKAQIEQLKKAVAALEERLAAQEKKQQGQQGQQGQQDQQKTKSDIPDLDRRVTRTERDAALHRVRIGGDYRFEAHSIVGTVPAHFDGMTLQNLIVKSMFTMNALGRPPASIEEISRTVAGHFSDYQYFTQGLSFDQLKQSMLKFPQQLQQQLFGMLMPSTFV